MAHLAVIISTLTCTGHNSVNLFALFTAPAASCNIVNYSNEKISYISASQ